MLYTIGHSSHDFDAFLALLRQHGVDAVADVRSHPYSRHVPQYTKKHLQPALREAGISYVFLGRELGARSDNPACYEDDRVQYDRLAQEPQFAEGLDRLQQGMKTHRIALMCAEKDPADCHRALLVARHLAARGIAVTHIHADGSSETQNNFESRLLRLCNLPANDMFKNRSELLDEAYRARGGQKAYRKAH